MSMLTYRYRIKDSTSSTHLGRMAGAINYVWNFCNEVSLLAFRRDKTFLSAYDLHKLTARDFQRLAVVCGYHPTSLHRVRDTAQTV